MTQNDRTIASIGLPRHDSPRQLAEHLRALARLLEMVDLDTAIRAAPVLAARGWPSGTLGDGGSSTGASIIVTELDDPEVGPDGERVSVSRVEAAYFARSRYDDVDRRLAGLLAEVTRIAKRDLAKLVQQSTHLAADILAHADDADEIPAGMGNCTVCEHFCNPKKNPNDRLRSGLCDACRKHQANHRDELAYDEWVIVRRQMLGKTEGAAKLQARFHQALGIDRSA
jgi:hypothetical protein